MNAKLQRVLSSIALIIWGGVLLYFYGTGRITKYLAPDFHSFVLAGGLGLVVVGLFNLLTSTQEASCGHDHGPDDSHDHESLDVHPVVALLILIIPLAFSVVYTKDGFSLQALSQKGLYDTPSATRSPMLESIMPKLTKELIEQQHAKNEAGFHKFSLMELFFTTGDPEMRDLVEGMMVETEGRMVKDPEGGPNQRRLYRLFITCCAADSQAIPIIVRFKDEVPAVEESAWMELSGTMRFPDEGEGPVPVLEVIHAKEGTAPPEESFMRGRF